MRTTTNRPGTELSQHPPDAPQRWPPTRPRPRHFDSLTWGFCPSWGFTPRFRGVIKHEGAIKHVIQTRSGCQGSTTARYGRNACFVRGGEGWPDGCAGHAVHGRALGRGLASKGRRAGRAGSKMRARRAGSKMRARRARSKMRAGRDGRKTRARRAGSKTRARRARSKTRGSEGVRSWRAGGSAARKRKRERGRAIAGAGAGRAWGTGRPRGSWAGAALSGLFRCGGAAGSFFGGAGLWRVWANRAPWGVRCV